MWWAGLGAVTLLAARGAEAFQARGVRYYVELATPEEADELASDVKTRADELLCFGWVQLPRLRPGAVAGEARCGPHSMHALLRWIHQRVGNEMRMREYQNGKIQLHFDGFERLNPRRVTCFEDEPFQCQSEDERAALYARLEDPEGIWVRTTL